MANIGSEVHRALCAQGKDEKLFNGAVDRALELFDLTIADPKLRGRLREIERAREVFCDAVLGGTEYNSDLKSLSDYCNQFAFSLRRNA